MKIFRGVRAYIMEASGVDKLIYNAGEGFEDDPRLKKTLQNNLTKAVIGLAKKRDFRFKPKNPREIEMRFMESTFAYPFLLQNSRDLEGSGWGCG